MVIYLKKIFPFTYYIKFNSCSYLKSIQRSSKSKVNWRLNFKGIVYLLNSIFDCQCHLTDNTYFQKGNDDVKDFLKYG